MGERHSEGMSLLQRECKKAGLDIDSLRDKMAAICRECTNKAMQGVFGHSHAKGFALLPAPCACLRLARSKADVASSSCTGWDQVAAPTILSFNFVITTAGSPLLVDVNHRSPPEVKLLAEQSHSAAETTVVDAGWRACLANCQSDIAESFRGWVEDAHVSLSLQGERQQQSCLVSRPSGEN